MTDTSPAPTPDAKDLLALITTHFVVFSALAVMVAVAAATVFLYGYLAVFDWRLVWVIAYPDVLKVGLVGLAVASTFAGTLGTLIDDAYTWTTEHTRSVRISFIATALLYFVFLGLALWWQSRQPNPHYALVGFIALSVVMVVLLTAMAARIATNRPKIGVPLLVNQMMRFTGSCTGGSVSKDALGGAISSCSRVPLERQRLAPVVYWPMQTPVASYAKSLEKLAGYCDRMRARCFRTDHPTAKRA